MELRAAPGADERHQGSRRLLSRQGRRDRLQLKRRETPAMRMFAMVLALAALHAPTAMAQAKAKGAYADANGLRYYYEIHGKGEPLLLLHGGLGSIDMFRPGMLPTLAKNRRVIAVDLHGHGRTALGERPISLPDIGDDMAVVLKKLDVAQVDVLGYSFGGGVGFRLAVQHPQMVRRLAMVSAGYAQDGFYPEMLPMQAQVGAAMADP